MRLVLKKQHSLLNSILHILGHIQPDLGKGQLESLLCSSTRLGSSAPLGSSTGLAHDLAVELVGTISKGRASMSPYTLCCVLSGDRIDTCLLTLPGVGVSTIVCNRLGVLGVLGVRRDWSLVSA